MARAEPTPEPPLLPQGAELAAPPTRTKVYATIYEGWGTPQERVTEKVVALEYGKDKHDLATVRR